MAVKERSWVRKGIRFFFVALNVVLVLAYLLAVVGSFVSPAKWRLLGPLTLGFPYLALALVFSFFFWLVVKPRLIWLPLITLVAGYTPLSRTLAWKQPWAQEDVKKPGDFTVATWNIQSFNGMSKNKQLRRLARTDIARQLLDTEADVLCLQEFNHNPDTVNGTNNKVLFQQQYPHTYFSREFTRKGSQYASGSVIFSKLPIRAQGKIDFPGDDAESLIYADVESGDGRLIRVFTTHLQSFRFSERDHLKLNQMEVEERDREGILRKLRRAYERRALQAAIVRKALEASPHPAVITGDFNDVPSSYAYHLIKGDWQDAFLAKSWGLGRTYLDLSPTLRIDYIMPSPRFEITHFDDVEQGLSDHVMLVARMRLAR